MLGVVGQRLAKARQRSRPKPIVHLQTSRWAFALWWLGLLLLHCVNLAYYVGVVLLYKMLDRTYLNFQLTTYKIGISDTEQPKVAKIHAFIAAIHAFFILLMVASSLYERKLVFQPDLKPVFRALLRTPRLGPLVARLFGSSKRTPMRHKSATPGDTGRTSSASISRHMSATVRVGSRIFARDGLLGVDSVYFDHILLVRELVETALQSYQLYRMTLVLPRMWLIRFYVVLLVANCWAVPFLHRYYRHRETTRRMLCLLCDAVLDMVSSIGVSVVIFSTYAPQYVDPHGFGFSFITWFDDEWISNMVQEFQMMLVASWGDMISRLVFAFGLLQCMDAIKEMLTPVPMLARADPNKRQDSSPPVAASPPGPSLVAPSGVLAETDDVVALHSTKDGIAPTKDDSRVTELAGQGVPSTLVVEAATTNHNEEISKIAAPVSSPTKANTWRTMLSRAVSFIVHVIGPGLFVVWGLVILVVHAIAESHNTTTACSLHLKPWLSTKPGCSLVELNCAMIPSNGHDAAMDAAWEVFDPDRASRVVIRHCPELRISPKIRTYHTMSGFKVYNSTLLEWNEQAAVTETDHSGLRSVILLRTTVPNGELPAGVLSSDFPKGLTNFYSASTNLKSLPADLDTKWPSYMQLVFESSLFTEVPAVVIRLKPNMVSMAGSQVSVIPPELVESPRLTVLQFGLTKVQELPPTVKSINPSFTALFLQYTNVTSFPAWLDGYARFITHIPMRLFNAFGSPYCRELNEIAAGNRTGFSSAGNGVLMDVSTPEKLAFVRRAVECTTPANNQMFYFPLPLEDIKHGLRA